MLNSSTEYKKAVVASSRQTTVKAVIDISEPDIIHLRQEASAPAAFAEMDQLINRAYRNTGAYATLELNRWVLGTQQSFLPDDGGAAGFEIGCVSAEVCGEDRFFLVPFVAEIEFANVESLPAVSLFFSDMDADGTAEDFRIEIFGAGVLLHSRDYIGNSAHKVIDMGFTATYPDTIRVTVLRWSLPGRRARILEIFPGFLDEWEADRLAGFEVVHHSDISNSSLKYGTATVKMDNSERIFDPRNKQGLFSLIEERQPVELSVGVLLPDGGYEMKNAGIFYQSADGWKTGENGLAMTWKLVDILGLVANREFVVPETLPTAFPGWLMEVLGQLGESFAKKFFVETYLETASVVAYDRKLLEGKKCGDILRFAAMAAAAWIRADAATGKLLAGTLHESGGALGLDNMRNYPVLKANPDVAAVVFNLYGEDGEKREFAVAGTNSASSKTLKVDNPFIHTEEEAIKASKLILSYYGGNQVETISRGDPASELGDVDTVALDASSAIAGRRIYQQLAIKNGVLADCKSVFLQAAGSALYEDYVLLTTDGPWQVPSGVTKLRVIIGGGGSGGGLGYDGSYDAAGEKGMDGAGGKIWYGDIEVTPGQVFEVTIGAGGQPRRPGADSSFGMYSSSDGVRYENGFASAATGFTFGRSGVAAPAPNSSDGGAGGAGGAQGVMGADGNPEVWPELGRDGAAGASGFVALFWQKGES